MTTPSFFQKLQAGFQKDEQWVMAEITKGWKLLELVGHTVDVDVQGLFQWIQSHQLGIQNTLKGALEAAATIGSLIPAVGPEVRAATIAIDAATVAIDALSRHVIAGTTPLGTVVNAYHAVKDAQSAVNSVVKAATAKPTP